MPIDNSRHVKQLLEAGKRWAQRSAARDEIAARLGAGGPPQADSVERVRAHIEWRSSRGDVTPLAAIKRQFGVTLDERILGTPDFKDRPPSPAARLAAQPVARIIELPAPGYEPQGFGTGFMVAPGVLMTNNHVLPDFGDVAYAATNFGYARGEGGVVRGTIHRFASDPNGFLTDEELDFSLVTLDQDPGLGYHPLLGAAGKILLGQPVSIIQHPKGLPRQYAYENNSLVDLLELFLHYTTDTEPGSSGSPVFNDHWEVVALHHSGVPRVVEGVIMARGPSDTPWNPRTMSDDDIDWVANEGVRISRIVERLRQVKSSDPRLSPLIDRVLDAGLPALDESEPSEYAQARLTTTNRTGDSMVATTIHIHAPTVIYTGAGAATTMSSSTAGGAPLPPPRSGGLDADEGISIDSNYAARKGYARDFLDNSFVVELPTIAPAQRVDIAPLLDGDASGVLKYHHFSIVMHGKRKLPFFTAVNIDGKRGKRPAREADKWFFDPRLDREHQIGEDLYRANPLDRGHLVRRLDPAWGTVKVAKVANDDTFHFTNCSPQHQDLNQKIWVDLEDYLLDNAQEDDVRLTVFTGPVFKADDPKYRGVQLPRRFWKVAVMRDRQGQLLTAGFVQSQRKMISGLKEADFLRQDMRTDQFKVAQIEALTGLSFGLPPQADAMFGEPDTPVPEAGGLMGRRLTELEDIKVR